jgi:mannose-1-phosphate guanylyltransferase
VQALVLAGGEGTRLRPLTLTLAKPVMPLAGRPLLTFMLDWLHRHGVDDVLLSCGYRSHDVERVLGHEHRGMRLRYVVEDEPLGTAGPLRLAADEGVLAERVLVLNGDCLTDIDLTAEIAQHKETGAVATLALVAVDDTSSYGVVPTRENGEVEAFLEKQPGPAPTNRINAGAYVLEREVLDRIEPGRPTSFEREVFPSLVGEGLYGLAVSGYWLDIGTPERYLEATRDILDRRVDTVVGERIAAGGVEVGAGATISPRASVAAPSLVGAGCELADGAVIGPHTVLGSGCTLAAGSCAEQSVLHDGVTLDRDATVRESIVGSGAEIGASSRVEAHAVIGPGAVVEPGATIRDGERVEAPEVPA